MQQHLQSINFLLLFIKHIFEFMSVPPVRMLNNHKSFFGSSPPSKCYEFIVLKCLRRNLTVFYKFNCSLGMIMSRGWDTLYILLSINFLFNRSIVLCTSQLFLIVSIINV